MPKSSLFDRDWIEAVTRSIVATALIAAGLGTVIFAWCLLMGWLVLGYPPTSSPPIPNPVQEGPIP